MVIIMVGVLTIERVYLLEEEDLDGLVRVRTVLKEGYHGLHQLMTVGRQDGHVVPGAVVELVRAIGAQDHLLRRPAATPSV